MGQRKRRKEALVILELYIKLKAQGEVFIIKRRNMMKIFILNLTQSINGIKKEGFLTKKVENKKHKNEDKLYEMELKLVKQDG